MPFPDGSYRRPDGTTYWEAYAREQSRRSGGGNVPWWVGVLVAILLGALGFAVL